VAGLYRIYRGGQQVYLGRATNLRARLLQHRWCLKHFRMDRELAEFRFRILPTPTYDPARRDVAERRLIRKEKRLGGLSHQRETEGDAFSIPGVRAVWAFWRRQLAIVARAFREQRYGCWCGPGNVCTQTRDVLDLCCKAHDNAYAAVGVSSRSSGGINMWSVEGLKRTEAADSALVACAARALTNPALGPAAHAYARAVTTIFGTRAQAARVARHLGL
jgi:hypothetical protein